MPSETTPLNANGNGNQQAETSWGRITDTFFQPFSSGALSKLPIKGQGMRAKAKRNDRIPDEGEQPLLTDYHSINDPTIRVRVPKKIATPVKVEAKVWFANERTFISYLSMGLLLSTISSGLLFGAQDGPARYFAMGYAFVSAAVLVYGYVLYQSRLTRISARDPGNFDTLAGPLLICAALFIAILANFIFRLQESKKHTGVNPMSFQNAWAQAGLKSSWLGKL